VAAIGGRQPGVTMDEATANAAIRCRSGRMPPRRWDSSSGATQRQGRDRSPSKGDEDVRQVVCGEQSPSDPLISPYWRLDGLPPQLVHAGEDEFLPRGCDPHSGVGERRLESTRGWIYTHACGTSATLLTVPGVRALLDEFAQFLRAGTTRTARA
jgi:hypothetical protein